MTTAEYLAIWRKHRRAEGLCVNCTARATPGYSTCRAHRAYARTYQFARRLGTRPSQSRALAREAMENA